MYFQKSKGQKSGVENSAKFIHGHEENPKLGLKLSQASGRVLGNFRNSVEFRAKF